MPPREDIPYLLRARPDAAAGHGAENALEEALAFPARLLCKLPVKSSFALYAADLEGEISITTRELPEPREVDAGNVVLDGPELDALVAGVEAERFHARDLRQLYATKVADPTHRLTREDALAGAQPVGAPMTLEKVLRRLEVALASVELEPLDDPDDLTQAA